MDFNKRNGIKFNLNSKNFFDKNNENRQNHSRLRYALVTANDEQSFFSRLLLYLDKYKIYRVARPCTLLSFGFCLHYLFNAIDAAAATSIHFKHSFSL